MSTTASGTPTAADLRRWRRHLADELAEAAVYRDLAKRRTGEEREILLALADAEGRHAAHWQELLGDQVGRLPRPGVRFRLLAFLARRLGSVFVLALAQRAETRATYDADADATPTMAADERIHAEVVRALATRGRNRLAGSFRAAVFGANDGLVSNVALIMGVAAAGVDRAHVLLTGLAGLLAGALSMGAGEFISVRSQRELLEASTPAPDAADALPHLDVDANELALVYRARGMTPEEAQAHAAAVMADIGAIGSAARRFHADTDPEVDPHEAVGTAWGAAISSFCFFATGALIPVLPYIFGLGGRTALVVALVAVGLALMTTGAFVGLISGGPPVRRALRQLAIGFSAAAVTYGLGALFGTTVG
jgi:VIT1/CCC1 family predicted Fe2+/Mn2+ transporter